MLKRTKFACWGGGGSRSLHKLPDAVRRPILLVTWKKRKLELEIKEYLSRQDEDCQLGLRIDILKASSVPLFVFTFALELEIKEYLDKD